MAGRSISSRGAPRPAIAAAALLAISLALFRPGFAEYDSVGQYAQALSGRYDDWHPPVMARLWSLLLAVAPGAGPMLAVQLAGYWLGLGLIAAALVRGGHRRAGWGVLAIGLWPPFLGWQAVVLKDGQAVAAMLAAGGVLGWWRLAGRPVPRAAWAGAALLLAYALLVRANTVFAVAPLVAGLLAEAGWRRRVATALAIVAGTLVLSPAINHHVLAAAPSGVEKTQPLYDLAGIAVRTRDTGTGFTTAEIRTLAGRRCVKPFFWDSLGDGPGCADVARRLLAMPAGHLYALLAAAAIAHPVAYAGHRLAHLNSTDRWWVALRWPGAVPPGGSEPNDLGLGQPGKPAMWWQWLAGWLVETPAGWPIAWIAVAAIALAAGWRIATPRADLARALLGSALALEASFAVVSIASDLRYHLWPMIAVALALVLAGRVPWTGRWTIALLTALGLVTAIGIVARITLPIPPQGYQAMVAG